MWQFRSFVESDLPLLVSWRNEPHVLRWFPRAFAGIEDARHVLADRLDGRSPVRMWLAVLDQHPVGFLQSFPVAADQDIVVRVRDPEAVCFDFLIGDPARAGRGLGGAMIAEFCRQVLVVEYPDAPRFLAAPDARNHRSLGALRKAGFEQGWWIQPEAADYAEVTCTAPREKFGPDGSTLGP